MNIAVFLGAVTIGLFFILGIAADHYGPDLGQVPKVADRFLERGHQYNDPAFLSTWVGEHRDAARGYAFPVLFPLDLLFMIFLGGFLCVGSMASADQVEWLKRFTWGFALLPALYVGVDLIEDTLLTRLLLNKQLITDDALRFVRSVTNVKFLASGAAIVQTICLSAIAIVSGR